MEDAFFYCIKNKFSCGEYNIKTFNNEKGLVIFSQMTDNENEHSENDKCLNDFKFELQPSFRYLYVEKITDNKYFNNREGVLTFVMINPSYADECKSDKTMDRARSWATKVKKWNSENKGYKYFTVINLFAYRHHKVGELKKFIKYDEENSNHYNSKNNTFINEYLNFCENVNDFVIAYGVSNDFGKQKEFIMSKKNIKNRLTFYSDKKPYHLLCRKKVYNEKHELNLYNLDTTNG